LSSSSKSSFRLVLSVADWSAALGSSPSFCPASSNPDEMLLLRPASVRWYEMLGERGCDASSVG
jgi:hypothetical protein